jgi:hypothetical protein
MAKIRFCIVIIQKRILLKYSPDSLLFNKKTAMNNTKTYYNN